MSSYTEAVAGWADHLRAGGTTTWAAWLAQGVPPAQAPAGDQPDALHLELLRRLNELGAAGPGSGEGAAGAGAGAGEARTLADVVLETPAPGRGMLDVPLPFSGDGAPRFGSPAVEPELLPPEELVRLCVGALATLLPGVPPEALRDPAPRWPLPGRRRFRVHGSPGSAEAVRRSALEQGAVESDWRPVHLVVACPVETMMTELWVANTVAGGILGWPAMWRRATAASGLPPAIDPVALAGRLVRTGGRVHVVVAADPTGAARLAAEVLGVRAEPARPVLDPAATDLLRRLNRLLALTAGPERVTPLGRTFRARLLPPSEDPRSALTAPKRARRWARTQGATAAAALAAAGPRAGYAVHGDPDALTRVGSGGGAVDRDRTLGLALAACLRAWQLQEGTPRMDRR